MPAPTDTSPYHDRFSNRHSSGGKGGPVNMAGKPAKPSFPEKGRKLPGLPGKKQPVDRSFGGKKVKAHVASEGI